MRFEPRPDVEVDQRLPDHGAESVDDVIPGQLDPDDGRVGGGVAVTGGHQGGDARLLAVTGRRVGH